MPNLERAQARGPDRTDAKINALARRVLQETSARKSDSSTLSAGSGMTVKGDIEIVGNGEISVTGQSLDWAQSRREVRLALGNRQKKDNGAGLTILQPGIYADSLGSATDADAPRIASPYGGMVEMVGQIIGDREENLTGKPLRSVGKAFAGLGTSSLQATAWDSTNDDNFTSSNSTYRRSALTASSTGIALDIQDFFANRFFTCSVRATPASWDPALLSATWQTGTQTTASMKITPKTTTVSTDIETPGDIKAATFNGSQLPAHGPAQAISYTNANPLDGVAPKVRWMIGGGVLQFDGGLSFTSTRAAYAVLCTLPSAYWPPSIKNIGLVSSAGWITAQIRTDGTIITVTAFTSGGWLALSSMAPVPITFP